MDWFIGHIIGDYLLQNDWMALNKKSHTLHCSVHCAIWALSVLLCACWPWWTLPVLFVIHFVQDRTNIVVWLMNHKGQKQFAQPPMAPWSIIVVDNSLHLTALWALSKFVRH
jgi:hypothetical protein